MGTNEDLTNAAKWLNECNSRINGEMLDDCTRHRISASLLHLALEHHGAIIVLSSHTPSPLYGSAAALLRPQFEAYVRGVWFHRCASEENIEKYTGGTDPPKIDQLIANIETLSGYEDGFLKMTKTEVWKSLCDFTHGGSSQVASRNNKTEIVSNYNDGQARGILYWSCVVTLQVSVAFANLLENELMAREVLSTYGKIFSERP